MQLRSADRSIVKAIRQRGLLTAWSQRHLDAVGQLVSKGSVLQDVMGPEPMRRRASA